MATPELVIFDNDGVLVDSEKITHDVMSAMTVELVGRELPTEMVHQLRGDKMADMFGEIERLLSCTLPEDFEVEFRARCEVAYERELQAVPGVVAVIDALPWKFCVASSGPTAKIRATLRSVGLLDRFEGKIFSAFEIGSWKPEPDLFLHAARSLSVAPEQCVVIEDSPPGVRAAVAAGMRVFGFAAGRDGSELSDAGAECVFHDMSKLPALLGLR